MARIMLHEETILEAHEHYRKRSNRNRAFIDGANGIITLSVPLRKGKNSGVPMRDVRIAYDEPWRTQHWHSIQSSYGKTPFFEHYEMEIKSLLIDQKPEKLFELNSQILTKIMEIIGLQSEVKMTEAYAREVDQDAQDYRFAKKSVESQFDWQLPSTLEYQQAFHYKKAFVANLSILDLIFCEGPSALPYLEEFGHFL